MAKGERVSELKMIGRSREGYRYPYPPMGLPAARSSCCSSLWSTILVYCLHLAKRRLREVAKGGGGGRARGQSEKQAAPAALREGKRVDA